MSLPAVVPSAGRRALRGAAVLLVLLPAAGAAQERVRLELRPRVGDTLRMVVEQQTAHSGSARSGAGGEASREVSTQLRLASRTIVLEAQGDRMVLLSITDSADISSTDPHAHQLSGQLERQLRGRAVRLLIGPTGAAQVLDSAPARGGGPRGLPELVTAMPAAFPPHPVSVGERWTREVDLPAGGRAWRDGTVFRATFRLDSLSRDRSLAYVSMRGTISRDAGGRGANGDVEMQGSVTGTMLLDRVRGWLADSRFAVVLHTTITPAGAARDAPMRFVTRITQHVRMLERR